MTEEVVFIALGSNLNDPREQVTSALSSIGKLPQTQIKAVSRWYQSRAVGPGQQPDYINGVAKIITALPPINLLLALQNIEMAHGRIRNPQDRWHARTLDLDILLYGDQILLTPELTIPHPHIAQRNFVLQPLADLKPELIFPDGTPLARLLENCSTEGIVVLSEGE